MKPSKRRLGPRHAIPLSAAPAMRRAAKRAREVARRFGTPVYVLKNGRIVALRP